MARITHGYVAPVEQLKTTRMATASALETLGPSTQSDLTRFDYLFGDLQTDPNALLPEAPATVENLRRLGATMRDLSPDASGDSTVPAIYTYLGQFIDHDITLEAESGNLRGGLNNPNLAPLPLDEARNALRNTRSATLDLDSVYGPDDPLIEVVPRDGDKLKIGKVSPVPPQFGVRPPGKDDFHDLPRQGRSEDPNNDRAARIGDPRNDENLIVAQLHLAFLLAHNALVEKGMSFEEARVTLRQHYQWIVLHDFLKQIVDPAIVDATIAGNRFYKPVEGPFFLPFEFSVAAYRFGHTMVRDVYDFNLNFGFNGPIAPGSLQLLFAFTALSGQLQPGADGFGSDTLPENWIIEWERFVGSGNTNLARAFDTRLVEPLFLLTDALNRPMPLEPRLAVRNLLRGYLLRMPTGQAVAQAMGITPMTPDELIAVAESVTPGQGQESQAQVLQNTGFHQRTPLWFYVLAEAKHQQGGNRLGAVGGTLVAEVLVGLVRRSANSILSIPGWQPQPGYPKTLPDLLRLAGVLDATPAPAALSMLLDGDGKMDGDGMDGASDGASPLTTARPISLTTAEPAVPKQ